MKSRFLLLLLCALFGWSPAFSATPQVAVSIKPLHSLVATVMEGLEVPALIVGGSASAHTYSLRPSDAAALQQAEIVFWAGPELEVYLADAIATLAPRARLVTLADVPGLALLPQRQGGAFEPDHDHETAASEDHAVSDSRDMHFFLDPANAALLLTAIAEMLAEFDPEHAATYLENAAQGRADLELLIRETNTALAPIRSRPIVVFHDAYRYFETRFGLEVVAAVAVNPEVSPSAERIRQIRERLGTVGATCVFAEPQFDARLVAVLVEGTGARSGVLDPEGASLEPGPDLYRRLIENLVSGLTTCLEG